MRFGNLDIKLWILAYLNGLNSPVGKQAWTFILTVLPTQIHIVRGIPLYRRGITLTPLILWLVKMR